MGDWEHWIGRKATSRDYVGKALLDRWLATLDINSTANGVVPQGFHWCLCLPDAPTSLLGTDGHPVRNENPESFLPPIPLPRRMWAASKVDFHVPLQVNDDVTRTSRIASITEKQGASGKLVFVDIAHETCANGTLCVTETQSIVYREAASASTSVAPPAPKGTVFDASPWETCRVILPTETLLFRYSALTFNSHRIHYDLPYATNEEGYCGLVVHGPLVATLLLELAQGEFGDDQLKSFSFRGMSPAISGAELNLVMRQSGNEVQLGAFCNEGRELMRATGFIRF